MDYNHVMERIGEVIDAAGVAVIVIGMLISAGAAAVGRSVCRSRCACENDLGSRHCPAEGAPPWLPLPGLGT